MARRRLPSGNQTGLYMVRADGSGLVHVPGTFFRNPPFADKAPDFFPEIQSSCAGVPVEQRGPGCYRIAYIRDSYTLGAGAPIRSVRGARSPISGCAAPSAAATPAPAVAAPCT